MPLSSLWEALGGLGLFLLGMHTMSGSLQKMAGERVRQFLEKITGNRLSAALVGSCLASALQSSSAASILVVGFINAGLISLYQALGVLLGTGIGATIAIQFIAFRVYSVALPMIFIGVVLKFFVKRRRWANAGELLLGAGLVFFGVMMMESGLIPIKENTLFQSLHNHLFLWRINAVLIGAILTLLVQSSSAAAGIIIAVTGSGLIGFPDGVAMIAGEMLGASLIAALASVNGTIAAKRTVLLFFLMNVLAVIILLILFRYLLYLLEFISPLTAGFRHPATHTATTALDHDIANAHTLISVLKVIIFLPFIGFFARSAAAILPGKNGVGDNEPRCIYIDDRVVNTPTIALLQAKKEVRRMADIARGTYVAVVEQLHAFDAKKSVGIRQREEVLDVLQRDISSFLVLLSRQQSSSSTVTELPLVLNVINNLEQIGDQCEALLDNLHRKKERHIRFSDAAMTELKQLASMVGEMISLAVRAVDAPAAAGLDQAQLLKEAIADQVKMMTDRHVDRLRHGDCTVAAGVLFTEVLSSFEKISDNAFNLLRMGGEAV
jgi:phosphate:Na+ symporter